MSTGQSISAPIARDRKMVVTEDRCTGCERLPYVRGDGTQYLYRYAPGGPSVCSARCHGKTVTRAAGVGVCWRVAPGDPTHVFAPNLAKPINCHSAERAAFVVKAVNAYLNKCAACGGEHPPGCCAQDGHGG